MLATAERQRREQLQKLRQQQQQQAAAGAACGDMPAPSPRPPHAQRTPALSVLQTPAAARGTASKSRLANSSDTGQQPQPQAHSTAGWTAAAAGGGAFQTPAAKASGAAGGAATVAAGAASTGAGAGAGGAAGLKGVMMASPAPLTVSKRASRGSRAAAAAGGNENQEPGAAAGAGGGISKSLQLPMHVCEQMDMQHLSANVCVAQVHLVMGEGKLLVPDAQHCVRADKMHMQHCRVQLCLWSLVQMCGMYGQRGGQPSLTQHVTMRMSAANPARGHGIAAAVAAADIEVQARAV